MAKQLALVNGIWAEGMCVTSWQELCEAVCAKSAGSLCLALMIMKCVEMKPLSSCFPEWLSFLKHFKTCPRLGVWVGTHSCWGMPLRCLSPCSSLVCPGDPAGLSGRLSNNGETRKGSRWRCQMLFCKIEIEKCSFDLALKRLFVILISYTGWKRHSSFQMVNNPRKKANGLGCSKREALPAAIPLPHALCKCQHLASDPTSFSFPFPLLTLSLWTSVPLTPSFLRLLLPVSL